jgi:uncharacterized protein
VQPLIVVPANDVDPAGIELTVELPQVWLDSTLKDAEAHATRPGSFRGRLSRSGKADVVVRAKIAAELELPCARCLGPAPLSVSTELSLLLKPRPGGAPQDEAARVRREAKRAAKGAAKGPAAAGATKEGPNEAPPAKAAAKAPAAKAPPKPPRHAEYEFSSAEADLDEYDGEKVILDDFVREAILLELPSFPLCTEGCEGGGRALEPGVEAHPPEVIANPFAALRHLLAGEALPPDDSAGNGRSPSQADFRRISRAKKRAMPKIRTSALQRGKK